MVLYAAGEKAGQLQLVTSCRVAKGFAQVRNARLKPQDKKIADGRLKVPFLLLLSTKEWVLAVGRGLRMGAGGQSEPQATLGAVAVRLTLAPEVMDQIKVKAAAEGFDVSKLIMIPQNR